MAGQAAKKVRQENARAIKNLRVQMIAVNVAYIAYRILLHRATFTTWTAVGYFSTSALVFFLYAQLQGMSHRTDISGAEGLVAYFYDVIYVTWFVHITSMFWDKMWYTYLVIPLYAFYKLYVSFVRPYLSSRGTGGNAPPDKGVNAERNQKRGQKTKIIYTR